MSRGQPLTQGSGKRKGNPRGSGDQLRSDILEAADHLIEARGDASALSLRAIAEHVGIATTSIYLHFADLTELKVAVAQRGFVEFAIARDQAAVGLTDPVEVLSARCLAYIDYAVAHPGRYRLMFGPQLRQVTPNQSANAPSVAALRALEDSIRQCAQAAAAAVDIDPARCALLLWTSLHGQASLQVDRPNFPWPPRAELVTELVRHLLGAPS